MSFKDIKVIVARDQNYLIGHDLHMPWGHFTDDLRLFSKKTKGGVNGNPLIIGGNTARSLVELLGGPYKDRTTIVVKHKGDPELEKLGFIVRSGVDAFDEAILYAEHECPGSEIWIAGGGMIYAEAFKRVRICEVHETIIDGIYLAPENVRSIYFTGFYENLYTVISEEQYKKRAPGTNNEKDRGNKRDFTVKVHRINF